MLRRKDQGPIPSLKSTALKDDLSQCSHVKQTHYKSCLYVTSNLNHITPFPEAPLNSTIISQCLMAPKNNDFSIPSVYCSLSLVIPCSHTMSSLLFVFHHSDFWSQTHLHLAFFLLSHFYLCCTHNLLPLPLYQYCTYSIYSLHYHISIVGRIFNTQGVD